MVYSRIWVFDAENIAGYEMEERFYADFDLEISDDLQSLSVIRSSKNIGILKIQNGSLSVEAVNDSYVYTIKDISVEYNNDSEESQNEKLTVKTTIEKNTYYNIPARLVTAVYDRENKLLDMNSIIGIFKEGEVYLSEFDINAHNAQTGYVSVFIWNDISSMKLLAE